MGVLASVQRRVHSLTGGLFANWMPPDKVDVGDYGILAGDRFVRDGSLRDRDIEFEVDIPEKSKGKLEYSDRAEIATSAALTASIPIPGQPRPKASAKIKFSGKGAFVYHLSGITTRRLNNSRSFFETIACKWMAGEISFDEKSVIVTEVRIADKATIVVSEGSSGSLELNGNFELRSEAPLADAKGSLTVANKTGSLFQWLAADGTVPIIGLVRPVMGPPGGGGTTKSAGAVLAAFAERIQDLFSTNKWDIRAIELRNFVRSPEKATVEAVLPHGELVLIEFGNITLEDFLSLNDPTKGQTVIEENVQTVAVSQRRGAA